jgi:crossover junction endodeoxyribonuclease RuvC
MIILGIDPGTRITGYGVIQVKGSSYTLIDFGTIRPSPSQEISEKYLVLFEGTQSLINKYSPGALSIESQFVYKNPQSALKLGMAKGAIMVGASSLGVPVFEYTPTKAKKAVVGNGHASKQQVQRMIQKLFNLSSVPEPEDAADAVALAVCHAQSMRFRANIK